VNKYFAEKPPVGVDLAKVQELINKLRDEFRTELKQIEERMGSLEERVKKLEEAQAVGVPRLSVEGSASYTVDWLTDVGPKPEDLDWPEDRYGFLRADLNLGFRVSEDWNANLHLLWVSGTEAGARDTERPVLWEGKLVGPAPIVGGQVVLGRQFVKYGYGFLLDNQFSAFDAVRWDRAFGSINLNLIFGDAENADTFRGYDHGVFGPVSYATDGVFGARLSWRTEEDRWHIGANALYTGIGDYKGYGVDLHFDIFPEGNYLTKVRAEWVYTDKDWNDRDPVGENLWWVDLNVLKLENLTLDFSYASADKGYAPHPASVLNPFYLSRGELLFRPNLPAIGAVTPGGMMLRSVFDVRLGWKIAGNWLNVRWFQGEDTNGNDLGWALTVGYQWQLKEHLNLGLFYGYFNGEEKGNDRHFIRLSGSYKF
jgi:opacity protein-like surface antigen